MHAALLEADQGIVADFGDNVPSYTDFAKTVILPDGKSKGGLLEPTPAQACIFQALDQGYTHVVIAKPVQAGATTSCLVPFFRRAIVEHQVVFICYPTSDVGKDIWTSKASPILANFGGHAVISGGGSKGGAARVITLPGGGRFIQRSGGGRGESGQAAVSGDAMLIDELDDWPDRRTVLNLYKRIKESPCPLIVESSTVKHDHDSLILLAYEGGTKTRLEFPCPLCGVIQRLVWDQVDIETCQYRCVHCLELWTEAQRKISLRNWKRVDDVPGASKFSFKWGCLDDTLNTLHEEVHGIPGLPGFLSAQAALTRKDHSEMRSFCRDRLTIVYLDDEQTDEGEVKPLSPTMLSERSEYGWAYIIPDLPDHKLWSRYVAAEHPKEAQAGVVVIDVQGDRIYWTLALFNYKGDSWDYAYGFEKIRMRFFPDGRNEPEPWSPGDLQIVLDRMRDLLPELTQLPLIHKVVDTRYEGAELAIWLRKNPTWRGVCGVTHLTKGHPVYVREMLGYDAKWVTGLGRWEIVTLAARERVHDAYRKPITEPGAAILPMGLKSSDHYLRSLCSWLLMTNPKTNVTKWQKMQKRDDFLDTRSYGMALIIKEVEARTGPRRPAMQYGVVGKVGS